MKKTFTLFLVCALAAVTVSAQRLLTEDFNYSLGQLTSAGGGANVSGGAWVTNTGTGKYLQVLSGNLTYPSYGTNPSPTSGHLLLDTTKGSAEDAYVSFDTVKTGTVYASFLVSVNLTESLIAHDSAIGDFFVSLLPGTSTSNYTGRLYIRKGAAEGTFNLGIAAQSYKNTPVSWIATDYATNTTHLVTIGYQTIDGPLNDVAKLWVNPPNVPTEPAAQASSTYASGNENSGIARFAVRQNLDQTIKGGTPKCQIDAIKISTSWADGTLPLQLKSFSVINNNGYAGLSWQTCNEINVKKFEIQKSVDARNFTAIADVEAKNATCATNYSFNDVKALSGTAYYRIRTVDNDGASSYSGVVSINGKIPVSINVYPNPVTNSLVMMHPKTTTGATIQIISLDGKMVSVTTIQQDAVQTSIDVSKLTKGNYIAVFTNGAQKQ
ncbi:MAG: T9SS type A sorting domain-containing protein, partial [Panacibacter sp.]